MQKKQKTHKILKSFCTVSSSLTKALNLVTYFMSLDGNLCGQVSTNSYSQSVTGRPTSRIPYHVGLRLHSKRVCRKQSTPKCACPRQVAGSGGTKASASANLSESCSCLPIAPIFLRATLMGKPWKATWLRTNIELRH